MPTALTLDANDLDDIRTAAAAAALRVGLSSGTNGTPDGILASLDQYMSAWFAATSQGAATHTDESVIFELGCLWGEQLVRALAWKWVRVQFDTAESTAVAVASADASLVIYPFQTIYFYCEGQLPVRIKRSYEILAEPGRVPPLPAGSLENVIDHID